MRHDQLDLLDRGRKQTIKTSDNDFKYKMECKDWYSLELRVGHLSYSISHKFGSEFYVIGGDILLILLIDN